MFKGILLTLCVVTLLTPASEGQMFRSETANWFRDLNTNQLNYGVAVSDVDGDGDMEWIVAGYNGANMVLKYDSVTRKYIDLTEANDAYISLQDAAGEAIGVCACDVDGDGREEIYFLNTNNAYSGVKDYNDKLFKYRNGRYEDLFSDAHNLGVVHNFAGRSAACIDRLGTGRYSIILATYAEGDNGAFGLIEMDESDERNDVSSGQIVLKNVAAHAGIDLRTGGRGIVVGPIIGTDGRSDIFFDNENGANALFDNRGNGVFDDIANQTGVADRSKHGRGVALADFNNDGLVDIVYGNWVGPHRLYLQQNNEGSISFLNAATADFATASPIRTVIAADFDNDGNLEVFQNNIVYSHPYIRDLPTFNSLFKISPYGSSVVISRMDIGDALEPDGYGTGGAVADLDMDGQLELLVAHGESSSNSLDIYSVLQGRDHHWFRVMPLTQAGAPARGALVTLTLEDDTRLLRIIDGGSGYLCQMEPVAHFGLGDSHPKELTVVWPDGQSRSQSMTSDSANKFYKLEYSGLLTPVPVRVSDHHQPSVDVRADPNRNGPSNSARVSEVSCGVNTFSNRITDHVTGCQSRRALRQSQCTGACSRGRNCCQAVRFRYRNVRFRCSQNGSRYSKRMAVGPRRCRCITCTQ